MVGFYYIYGWLLHLWLVQQASWELSLNWFAIYPQRCIWNNEYLAIMYGSNRSFNIPPPPGHTLGIWHLCRPGEEGIWLSESSRGSRIWSPCVGDREFELHPQFHVKSLAWRAVIPAIQVSDDACPWICHDVVISVGGIIFKERNVCCITHEETLSLQWPCSSDFRRFARDVCS